jgi:hypothetical protein
MGNSWLVIHPLMREGQDVRHQVVNEFALCARPPVRLLSSRFSGIESQLINGQRAPHHAIDRDRFSCRCRSSASLTFALPGHFRRWSLKILFAFNGGTAETRQVKTLPLF